MIKTFVPWQGFICEFGKLNCWKTRPKPFFAFIFAISFPCRLPIVPGIPPHRRRPLRPPLRRVESDGVGVTSSILPIFIPDRASARRADWAPGPGVLVPLPIDHVLAFRQYIHQNSSDLPPVALILMCSALMPNSLHLAATS